MPRRPAQGWNVPLALLAGLMAGLVFGVSLDRNGLLPGSPPREAAVRFQPFWQTWRLAEAKFVDRAAVQPDRMTQGAIDGMLASLGDVGHTTYLTPEEVQQFAQALKGELEGIGARMTVRKQQPAVAETFPGSPARKAGVRPGDVILAVDGKAVANLPLDRVAALVRGPAGTVVHLRLARGETNKVIELDITRGKVDVPLISWAMVPGRPVAHIALREFGHKADEQFRAALNDARAKGAKGLIFDVRGNPGGLKEQAVAVTSEFLKDGVVFIEQDSQGNRISVPVKPGGKAADIPLVVLIDQGSASSSEIFAGAVQDHGRGKLVGMKTFGTGTVLQPFDLSDGSAVLLAVAQWFTPEGRQIWHKGIQPDVEVALPDGAGLLLPSDEADLTPEALAKSEDKQFLRALDVLTKQLK